MFTVSYCEDVLVVLVYEMNWMDGWICRRRSEKRVEIRKTITTHQQNNIQLNTFVLVMSEQKEYA